MSDIIRYCLKYTDVQLTDDPYSLEQLRDPRMNISVVRPLVDKFYEMNDVSVSKLAQFLAIGSYSLV